MVKQSLQLVRCCVTTCVCLSHVHPSICTPCVILLSSCTCSCGPLSWVCCMWCEANSQLKHLVWVSHTFKNIGKTLATRHQNYLCLQLLHKERYLLSNILFCSGKFFIWMFVAMRWSITICIHVTLETPVAVKSFEAFKELLAAVSEMIEDSVVHRYVGVPGQVVREIVDQLCGLPDILYACGSPPCHGHWWNRIGLCRNDHKFGHVVWA